MLVVLCVLCVLCGSSSFHEKPLIAFEWSLYRREHGERRGERLLLVVLCVSAFSVVQVLAVSGYRATKPPGLSNHAASPSRTELAAGFRESTLTSL